MDQVKNFIVVSSVVTIKKQNIILLNLWRAVHPAEAQARLGAAVLPVAAAGVAVVLVAEVRAAVGKHALVGVLHQQSHTLEITTTFTLMSTQLMALQRLCVFPLRRFVGEEHQQRQVASNLTTPFSSIAYGLVDKYLE